MFTTLDFGSRLHEPEPRRLRHIDSCHRWANQCGIANVMQLREHGPIPTFYRQNTSNDMDAILMPRPLASACLLKAGVLISPKQRQAPSDSEHWPAVAAFNIEAIVGLDGET